MKLAIVGVTGLVGREMLRLVDEGYLNGCDEIIPIAGGKSVGSASPCLGREWTIKPLDIESFEGASLASFSVGDELSAEWVPKVLDAHTDIRIVDKSNAFRMAQDVPLVVAGINDGAIRGDDRLIANPNCTVIQLALSVNPLCARFELTRVIAASYQSVSGGGRESLSRMGEEIETLGFDYDPRELNAVGYFHNVLPKIGALNDAGYASEEQKIIHELPKILGVESLSVSATAARVDTFIGHSIAVWVELTSPASLEEVESALKSGFALDYIPNEEGKYPTPVSASRSGFDLVEVGRLRKVDSEGREYAYFTCANNLRIGAALNALRIGARMLDAARRRSAPAN